MYFALLTMVAVLILLVNKQKGKNMHISWFVTAAEIRNEQERIKVTMQNKTDTCYKQPPISTG